MSVTANITANVHVTGEHWDTQRFQRLSPLMLEAP